MSDLVPYEIVSPEKLLRQAEASMVVVPGVEGDFGVLPDHAPMMSTMRSGVIEIHAADNSSVEQLFVKGGLAQVQPDGLTILADDALELNEVEVSVLAKEIQDLREDIEDEKDDQQRHHLEAELGWRLALQDALQ